MSERMRSNPGCRPADPYCSAGGCSYADRCTGRECRAQATAVEAATKATVNALDPAAWGRLSAHQKQEWIEETTVAIDAYKAALPARARKGRVTRNAGPPSSHRRELSDVEAVELIDKIKDRIREDRTWEIEGDEGFYIAAAADELFKEQTHAASALAIQLAERPI